jgi:predicted cobalt transporter CbtA
MEDEEQEEERQERMLKNILLTVSLVGFILVFILFNMQRLVNEELIFTCEVQNGIIESYQTTIEKYKEQLKGYVSI